MLLSPVEALRQLFRFEQLPNLPPRYNIAPSQPVAAVRLAEPGGPELVMLRWGLVPYWAEDPKGGYKMINARSETVDRLPAFREAYRRRRCLIPADGFYEWQKFGDAKQPMLIRRQDRQPFAFAGLWERWRPKAGGDPIESCAILTTIASRALASIHQRMPVILAPDAYDQWLDQSADPRPLLRPAPEDWLTAQPVSPRINSPRFDDPECITAPTAALPVPGADEAQGRLL